MNDYRVFHLIKGLGRGGAERLLIDGMKCRDQNFTYGYGYFLPWKDALVPDLKEQGADVICFQKKTPVGILTSYSEVARFFQSWKPDLLHCHLPLAGITGRLAARKSKLPVVYTEHNLIERYHPLTRLANSWTWKWQDRVVAVSAEVADSIHAHINSQVPVDIIRNGITVESMIPSPEGRISVRKEFNIPEKSPVIGTVSALRAGKNLLDWIRAAKLILESHPSAHFLIVGDGPVRESLISEAASCAIQNQIHFAGLQQNVIPFYSAMDIFLSSSTFEGLPLALLEAMAMRLPVVATRVGGVPEVVKEGQSGFLVPPKYPDLLAQKVKQLLTQHDLRESFGNCGHSIVCERFSIQRMTQELEHLYTEMIVKRRNNAKS